MYAILSAISRFALAQMVAAVPFDLCWRHVPVAPDLARAEGAGCYLLPQRGRCDSEGSRGLCKGHGTCSSRMVSSGASTSTTGKPQSDRPHDVPWNAPR